MIWTLYYYNSLPDMPSDCSIFSPEIMHRDFFKCNPTNTGHFEYPKFEYHSYDERCHKRELNYFLDICDDEKYTIFYTRHTKLDGTKENKIVGYYRVGKLTKRPRGFYASERVLLPKSKCIDIDYTGRGVPVSWGKSKIRDFISTTLSQLRGMKKEDISEKYKSETIKVMKNFKNLNKVRALTKSCSCCSNIERCLWGSRGEEVMKDKIIELYG